MPVAHAQGLKKPIYDDDEDSEFIAPAPGTNLAAPTKVEEMALTKSEIVSGVTIRTSSVLEEYIGQGRAWLHDKTVKGQEQVNSVFDRYLNAERNVTSTLGEIKSDSEDILPGGIYVLVSTLSGSILVRNRNILLRGVAPAVFGIAAFRYFLPQTFDNTGKLIWKFEQKAPALADAHVNAHNQVEGLVKDVNTAVADSKAALESGVRSARKFVIDSTGIEKKN